MLEPFPGLTEEDRAYLKQRLESWQGENDPDRDLWEARKEHPDLRIEDSKIVVMTDPVVIEYKGRNYQLGQYVIRVPLYPSQGVYTTIHSCHRRSTAQHPHVSKEGVVCFGEAASPFIRALGQGRYGDAITVLKSMLQGYNPDSPVCTLEDGNWTSGLYP